MRHLGNYFCLRSGSIVELVSVVKPMVSVRNEANYC